MKWRWVLKKKKVRGKLGKCQHLRAFAKKKCIFLLLKVSFEAPPRFYFNFFYDLWHAGKKKKKRAALPHKCRETAQGLRDKEHKKLTRYIFCGSFYYYDSLAYGVGVMWKISINMKGNILMMESHTDLIFYYEISLRVSINLTFVPKNGSTRRSWSIFFNDLFTFFINLIHSCIKSENSNASVSSHQILVHFAVLAEPLATKLNFQGMK